MRSREHNGKGEKKKGKREEGVRQGEKARGVKGE